jgi:hypothetical protein
MELYTVSNSGVNLNNIIDNEVIYFNNTINARRLPLCLENVGNELMINWRYSSLYEWNKTNVYAFNINNNNWNYYSHPGYIAIYNCNDIDFIITINNSSEEIYLNAGGLVLLESQVKWKYICCNNSTELKHIVVFSLVKK